MRRLRLPLLLLAAALALAAGLLFSNAGLQALVRLAVAGSGGALAVSGIDGRLAGPLRLGEVRWQQPARQLVLHDLALDWTPAALFAGRLEIARLELGELHIDGAGDDSPATLPDDLELALTVDLQKLRISTIHYGTTLIASEASARLRSDGRMHRIDELALRTGDVVVHGSASLDGRAPFAVAGGLDLRGDVAGRPLALGVHAGGRLADLRVDILPRAGLSGEARLQLAPFAAQPLSAASVRLRQLDPAAWQAGWPAAALALDAELVPAAAGVSARFTITNERPGPLNRPALPFAEIAGELRWQDGRFDLPELRASFPGAGEIAGNGRWQGDGARGAVHLALRARQLDAARLLGALRPTRLAGRIDAEIGAAAQQATIDLADARFALRGEVRHAASTVDLDNIQISADGASLRGRGQLALANLGFALQATLQRFDPSRFAALPPARINAELAASGRLRPTLQADARFTLGDSELRGRPLRGHGSLALAWPRISAVDVDLAVGSNRLQARGGFGAPAARLRIDVDAPHLAEIGGEGGIAGRIEVGGSLAAPTVDGELRAASLGLPGSFQLRGLHLAAAVGAGADAPLRLALAIDRLHAGGQQLDALRLELDGRRPRHRLQLAASLDQGERLRLALAGGYGDGRWQGQVDELRLDSPLAARQFRLLGAAPLQAAADGWQLGPLTLAGAPLDWQATLTAGARGERLNLDLSAGGSRVGRVDGRLEAALASPWQLATTRPWQGSLTAAIGDLGWLGELIGDDWHTAGRLDARLALSGTPARPRLDGTLAGRELALRNAESGMTLNDGELAADIGDNLLAVRRLRFANPHTALPRALRLALGDGAAALAQPGRLEISGEMRVDREHPDGSAALDIRLERLGVRQRPDQWLALSGSGRLGWTQAALAIDGKLAIDGAWWQLAPAGAPRLSDDVVVRRPGAAKAAPPRPNLALDLGIDLGRHFLFDGAGLSTRLAGEVRLSAAGRDLPRASGSIRTRDGRFEAYGQQLEISRGILTFQGLPDNPALDVRAVRKGLAVEPGVQLSGTARKPVVKLISDPDLPDAEKLAWLILGHGPESVGAGDASVLLAAAGGLLGNEAGGLVQQLKRTFALDEFGVRQGNLDGSEARQPGSRVVAASVDTGASTGNQILTVGKRLSNNATLSYEQSLGTAESIVKLSIALTRRLTLVGRAGSNNAVDLFYTLTWGQPPRRGETPP